MKKKISTIFVVLALMVSCSVAIYGRDDTGKDKILMLMINGIDFKDSSQSGKIQGVSYEASTNTITLDNCNIVTDTTRFISYIGDIPLNIIIKGNNNITGTESDGKYILNFIDCESYKKGGDSSVNITGGGTLNLNKVKNIAYNYIIDESKDSVLNINNMTINAEGGGFYFFTGNMKIENSTIKIDNLKAKGESGIRAGADIFEYGGKVEINKSLVEIKVGKSDENDSIAAIKSRYFYVNGLNIYAGETSAKWKANEKSLFSYTDDNSNKYTKSTSDYIRYVLITSQTLDLPDINIVNDKHTSYIIKDEKAPTYFENGYTGNKVCDICGKTILTGKVIAKKAISAPTIKRGRKKFSIKYKTIPGATGFQIRYKKIGGKWKVKKYKGNKNCSKTIKGLKRSKKYYVQLRAVKGKKYSNWSKSKTVKIK